MTTAGLGCRICAGETIRVFDLRSHRHGTRVPVYRCAACNAYFSNGGPVDYEDVDLSGYYLQHADAIGERYERLFTQIGKWREPGRFMDIGAGMGFSLEVARRHRWLPQGIEPNKALAKGALERGLQVANAFLADDTAGQFDVVLLDNVLEHILDPLPFLRNAARLLAPDALLIVAVPPMDWLRQSLSAVPYVRQQVMRPQINLFTEVDEHVNVFSRRAMRRLVANAALRLLDRRYHHSPLFDNAPFRALGLDDGYYFIAQSPGTTHRPRPVQKVTGATPSEVGAAQR